MIVRSRYRVILCATLVVLLYSPTQCYGQTEQVQASSTTRSAAVGTLATPITLRAGEEVHDGDLVSYNPTLREYELTRIPNDPYVYGVIVLNPVLYGYDETVDNAYPVVRYGEVEVNVSTINGELHAGDLVASSRVIGLGQRFEGAQSGQVLGIAVSDMEYEPTAISVDGEVVRLGRISVALQIGRQDVAVTDIAENIENDQDYIEREEFEKWLIKAGVQSEGNTFMFVRYSVGSLVTLAAFILAIRRFGGFFKESIAAVGRNPMAHQQIKSLIVWNTFMIVVIGGTGLIIGMIIMLA